MRRSQWDHSVTGRRGSVHPEGHPIVQSVKAGFKARGSIKCFSPLSKITRNRWEERNRAGVQPADVNMSHMSVQACAAFLIPIWLPTWSWSVLNWMPSGLPTMHALLPAPLNVGVGQNEEPFTGMRPANFRR